MRERLAISSSALQFQHVINLVLHRNSILGLPSHRGNPKRKFRSYTFRLVGNPKRKQGHTQYRSLTRRVSLCNLSASGAIVHLIATFFGEELAEPLAIDEDRALLEEIAGLMGEGAALGILPDQANGEAFFQ